MGTSIIDLTGRKFGHLTVSKLSDHRGNHGKRYWECVCVCGKIVAVAQGNLQRGAKSCGCKNGTHGHTGTRVHRCWKNMKKRCFYSKTPNYHLYGGRGITVCERWLQFENFLADMGEPGEGQSLDRIDSNGNYEPSNCRWANKKTQDLNRRSTQIIEHNGKTMCKSDWAREFGLDISNFSKALKSGMSIAEIEAKTKAKSSSAGD